MVMSESTFLTLGHIWVHDLILARICVDVQGQSHLGSIGQLNLVVCILECCPHGMNAGELAPPFISYSTWEM